MKVLTAQQMQAVDRRAIFEIGIPGVVLMENAGRGVVEAIMARYHAHQPMGAIVLAGKGNNGGDGYVVARLLQDRGWSVTTVVLAERSSIAGDAVVNLNALDKCGGEIVFAPDEKSLQNVLSQLSPTGVLVDALFGTGLSKAVMGHYAQAIAWLNQRCEPVVAVDIPSGVDASTGRLPGECVQAEVTITFAFPKIGQVSYPGAGLVGELVTVDIGIPTIVAEQAAAECELLDDAIAASLLPQRDSDGHKGRFGHLLVVAGSTGKGGAAIMAAQSGLRGGAGLVTLACPQSVQPVLAGQLIEVMTAPLEDFGGEVSLQAYEAIVALCADKQALAIGPGIGLGDEPKALARRLLQDTTLPLVIDADGLSAIEGHLEILARRQGATVLTPHPGEMARLCGVTSEAVQQDRYTLARDFAVEHKVVLVLKGARTLIACPDGQVYVNPCGHAGMASGGMGDVLTGLVGSLLAQGLEAFNAAALAVYLHGFAADRLLGQFGDAGLLATDLMRELPAARRALIWGGRDADC
ncbi:MAG: NAD(P)H-hydrate dehydratase [Desulfuromonadales bacterium]|nr:NAD(P)H-hydrate dehydratase [Desulfuromonadales bacterium]